LTSVDAMRARLGDNGVIVSDPLGFDNTYALAVRRDDSTKLGLRTISDLARHPELRAAFDAGFLERPDGWPGLQREYGLRFADVRTMEHALTYPALARARSVLSACSPPARPPPPPRSRTAHRRPPCISCLHRSPARPTRAGRAVSTNVGGAAAPAGRPHRQRDDGAAQRARGPRASVVRGRGRLVS